MFDVNVWELIFTDAPYPDVGNSGSGGLSIDPEQLRFAVGFPKMVLQQMKIRRTFVRISTIVH